MKNRKKANTLIYLIFFFVFFLAICAFAVDASITFANREQLQSAAEIAALAGASEFATDTDGPAAKTKAKEIFDLLMVGGLKDVNSNRPGVFAATTDTNPRRLRIEIHAPSRPIFLSFLGVSVIRLKALTCAASEDLSVKDATGYGSNVIWMSSKVAYTSDIIAPAYSAGDSNNYRDTAILTPLDDVVKSASYKETPPTIPHFPLIQGAAPTTDPLSLGPGGYLTIKFPAPIVDKTGNDFYIEESGDAQEGYMVFIGIDSKPDDPYIDSARPGAGINWVNISCAGKDNLGNPVPQGTADITIGTTKTKVYGSAYFDIGNTCVPTNVKNPMISTAKYLRIIDDNKEDAYYGGVGPINIYGEASTATPGADINAVTVLNHVKLITPPTTPLPN